MDQPSLYDEDIVTWANAHWREEILPFHSAALRRYEKSMHRRIRWSQAWTLAQAMANSSLIAYSDALMPRQPEICPISLEEISVQPFDIDADLRKITGAASSH